MRPQLLPPSYRANERQLDFLRILSDFLWRCLYRRNPLPASHGGGRIAAEDSSPPTELLKLVGLTEIRTSTWLPRYTVTRSVKPAGLPTPGRMPGRGLANHRQPSVPSAGILANQRPPSFRHCVQPLLSVRNYNTSTKQNNPRETPCTRDQHARKTPVLGVRISVLIKSGRFIPCRADVFERGICKIKTKQKTLSPTAAK